MARSLAWATGDRAKAVSSVFDTWIQINLQQGFGGDEVFTALLARRRLGIVTLLLVGATGLRYRDPREDGGAGFENALKLVLENGFRFDKESARAHLQRFSEDAFMITFHLASPSSAHTSPTSHSSMQQARCGARPTT